MVSNVKRMMPFFSRSEGRSRALLKLSGSLVHDYATISDDSPSPNRASRATEGSDQRGHILTSLHPAEPLRRFEHPGGHPAQHHRPRRASVSHGAARGRVRLRRLSMAFVVASDRWRRSDRPTPSTVSVSSSPSRTRVAALG